MLSMSGVTPNVPVSLSLSEDDKSVMGILLNDESLTSNSDEGLQTELDLGEDKRSIHLASATYLTNEEVSQLTVPAGLPHNAQICSETEQGEGLDVALRREKLKVTVRKVFPCPHENCGKTYTTNHHLLIHQRVHSGIRPYQCQWKDCNRSFTTAYAVKSHMRTHTGEKPYKCTNEECTKAFKTSGDLQKHIRTHTGERPFRCPYEGCNKAFTTSNIRHVHIRVHTGERPYVCEHCSKNFSSATNYRNHLRIHTGEKPYVCLAEGCGRRFTEYSSLYKHHIVHTHSKPYICNRCNKTYRQASTLALHKRGVHNEDLTLEETQQALMSKQILSANDTVESVQSDCEQSQDLLGLPPTDQTETGKEDEEAPAVSVPSELADDDQSNSEETEHNLLIANSNGQNVILIANQQGMTAYAVPLGEQIIQTSFGQLIQTADGQIMSADGTQIQPNPAELNPIVADLKDE